MSLPDKKLKVFINAIPKSGTHLAMRCISLFPGITKGIICSGPTPYLTEKHSAKDMIRTVKKVKYGCFFSGHLGYRESFVDLIEAEGIKTCLVVRDPRDVVVSTMYFLKKLSRNPLHIFFMALPNDTLRLKVLIAGFEIDIGGQQLSWPGISDIYRIYRPWVKNKKCCLVSFEKLVGKKGGGDDISQTNEIKKIGDHLGIQLNKKQLASIGKSIYFRKEVNFRKGIIGDWRNHFTNEHRKMFKECAGQTLVEWGYEASLNW